MPGRFFILLAVVVVMLISSCSSDTKNDVPINETEQRGPAGPIPVGLDRFYTQPITWGACAPYANSAGATAAFEAPRLQCARMTVPLDYNHPAGDTITVGLLRHKATKPDQRIGSLVLNPGGPGASGMQAAASLTSSINSTPLGERFDFVGFDPRGIGASEPQVKCRTDQERDIERAEDISSDDSPQGVVKQEAQAQDFVAKCLGRTDRGQAMLANVGTRDVARDLDVLRAVLGDPQLTYLGFSYGTRIGYTYAEAFPAQVRAMVLDGALDPEQDAVESLVAQGQGFGTAFAEFAQSCVTRPNCALGTDPAAAVTTFQNLTRPLRENPARVADGRQLSYGDATLGAIQALYSQQLWELLNTGLNELKMGQGTVLMALADQYNEREPQGKYVPSQDVFTAIRCVDDPPITDKNKILDAENRYDQAAGFLDDGQPNAAALDPCAFWPAAPTSQPHQPKVDGVAPPLVISTTNDPATPYQAGVNLAKSLKGGLLTYEGTQHTAFLQGISCVDQVGTSYLIDKTLPAAGKRCTG